MHINPLNRGSDNNNNYNNNNNNNAKEGQRTRRWYFSED